MLAVYHNNRFTECCLDSQLKEGMTLSLVATVDTDDLEEGYRLTNNIDHPWPENEGVKCLTDKPRSTSVGDMLQKGGSYYLVESCRFRELTNEELARVMFF